MRLFYSKTSPYARKARMAIVELGLEARVDGVALDPWAPDSPLPAHNPLGKVPTLETDEGDTLFDSPLVCEYLDAAAGGGRLFPPPGPERWTALRQQALADGIVDAGVLRVVEGRRPEELRQPSWIERQRAATIRGLDALERDAARLPKQMDIGAIAVLCCLGYLDLRFAQEDWRPGRPNLTAWFDRWRDRPSFQATVPEV